MKSKMMPLAVAATFYPFTFKGDEHAYQIAILAHMLDIRAKRYITLYYLDKMKNATNKNHPATAARTAPE